jgi:hypothetical protein
MEHPRSPEYYTELYDLLHSPYAMAQFWSYTWRWQDQHVWKPFSPPPSSVHRELLINSGQSDTEGSINMVIRSGEYPEVGLFPQISDEVYMRLLEYGLHGEGAPVDKVRLRGQLVGALRDKCISHPKHKRMSITNYQGEKVRGALWILGNERKWLEASKEEIKEELMKWEKVKQEKEMDKPMDEVKTQQEMLKVFKIGGEKWG